MDISIAILNYNGVKFLEKLIPSLEQEIDKLDKHCEVIVLDNLSSENDEAWVKKNYSWIKFIKARKNELLYSYNWLLQNVKHKYVLLLNNDTIVINGEFKKMLKYFDDKNVFAVGGTTKDWNNKKFTCGPATITRRLGCYYFGYDYSKQVPCYTLATIGAVMAVDREKFNSLNGFDYVYYPGYCEEGDLCVRAWRRGWKCIFNPNTVILHYDGGTFKRFSDERQFLQLRSAMLFQWIHFPSKEPLIVRDFYFVSRCIRHLLKSNKIYLRAWISARRKWSKIKLYNKYRPMSKDEYNNIMNAVSQKL